MNIASKIEKILLEWERNVRTEKTIYSPSVASVFISTTKQAARRLLTLASLIRRAEVLKGGKDGQLICGMQEDWFREGQCLSTQLFSVQLDRHIIPLIEEQYGVSFSGLTIKPIHVNSVDEYDSDECTK